MSLVRLLQELRQLNIILRAEDGQVRIMAPQGVFTTELRQRVALYKEDILAYLQKEMHEPAALSPIVPNPAERNQPFPLTDIQHAYWIGQVVNLTLENSYHFYQEIAADGLDPVRLNQAWQMLIARHDILRAVVLASGQQQFLTDIPPYQIALLDLMDLPAAEQQQRLLVIRAEMAHQVLSLYDWPLFDIRVTRLDATRSHIHISLALIMMDAASVFQLMREWNQLYHDLSTPMPPFALSYRDYVMWNEQLVDTPQYQQARDYWLARLDTLPPAPQLPVRRQATRPENQVEFVRHLLSK